MTHPVDPALTVVEPTEALRDAYLDFVAEFSAAGEGDIPGSGASLRGDFAAWIGRLRDHARGHGLAEGRVPASTFWLVRDGRVLGCCNLRHRLTPHLREIGGHVGFSVRPSERGRGFAKDLLRFALGKARELGIERVLVTCDQDNVASARVIRACGGELEATVRPDGGGPVVERYGIAT